LFLFYFFLGKFVDLFIPSAWFFCFFSTNQKMVLFFLPHLKKNCDKIKRVRVKKLVNFLKKRKKFKGKANPSFEPSRVKSRDSAQEIPIKPKYHQKNKF